MAGNLTFNVDANDQASGTFAAVAAELKELGRQLDKIDGRNVKAKVTINTPSSGTIAQLNQARAAIAEIDGKNARARVDIAGVPDPATVRQLRAAAKALRDLDGRNASAAINVTGNLPNARDLRAAARALKDLQDIHAIDIHISITGAVEALAQVSRLRQELRAIPRETTTTVNVDVDKGMLTRIAGVGSTLAKIGAAGGLAAAGLGSAVPAAATLAGSLVSLVGLAPIAVAGLAAMGVTAIALKVGLKGVGDALKESDPKKFAESLKGLAPAAQAFVTAYRQIKPALDSVQLDTQQKLFQGLGTSVKQLAATYLPTMKTNLGGVATELNGVAKNVVAFARAGQTVQDVNTIFDNTRVALHNAAPAANNLLGAFRDISVVGSDFLPGLATGWTNVTQRFQTFISEARQSGQLKVWIQDGIDTLSTLGSIAGNVGSVLGSVFTAAKASGADFLSTLDKVTGKLADLLASDTGQSALTAFFKESRQAIDALLPGVEALATGVLKMIQSFSTSGGLQTFATTVSGIAQSLAPLLPMLGDLAGGVLRDLSSGASVAASALGPLVGLVTGVVGALGPLPALVIAAVVAFKALGSAAIAGSFATLASRLTLLAPAIGTYAAGLTGSLAAGRAAQAGAAGLGTAIGKFGAALPIVGIALIGLGVLLDEFGSKADESAKKVINGSETMQQAIAAEAEQLGRGTFYFDEAAKKKDMLALATENVTKEYQKQYAALSPMDKLQADVSMSQAALNDAVAQFGATSPQATAAGQRLAAATQSLKTAHDGAAQAAMTQEEKEQALADSMSSQIDTALAYAQAVQRTADAHKAADDALKAGGAKSEEYKGAVLALASAMSSQADAARKQATALGGVEAGAQAYNTEILRTADLTTKAGRDAFTQLAEGLDDAGLKAISTAAEMSNLRTEIITLPDGRKVTVVVEADRAKLDSVKQGVEDLASKKYIGTIQILAETTTARGDILQTVQLADGTRGTIRIDADGGPAILTVGATKYTIDSTTGTIKVLGDVAPGETSLAGLTAHVDATTGQITIDANPAPADAKTAAVVGKVNSSIGTITIDGNGTLANGKTTSAVQFADGSKGTITIDGNQTPANGKVTASVTYANGSRGTIQVDANTAAANAAINNAARTRTAYINVITVGATSAGNLRINNPTSGGGVFGYAGGGVVGGRAVHARTGLVVPGYAPGRDTVPAVLSKGEAVLVPELVRALGANRILAANREASGGRPASVTGNLAGLMDGTVGGRGGGHMAGRISSALGPARGGGTTITNTFHATFTSTVPTGSVEVRKAIAWLNDELRKYNRDGK